MNSQLSYGKKIRVSGRMDDRIEKVKMEKSFVLLKTCRSVISFSTMDEKFENKHILRSSPVYSDYFTCSQHIQLSLLILPHIPLVYSRCQLLPQSLSVWFLNLRLVSSLNEFQ